MKEISAPRHDDARRRDASPQRAFAMPDERERLLSRAESDAEEGRAGRARSGRAADARSRRAGVGVVDDDVRRRATHGATSDVDGSGDDCDDDDDAYDDGVGGGDDGGRAGWGGARARRMIALAGSATLVACACGAAFGAAHTLRGRSTADTVVSSASMTSGDPNLAGFTKKEFADSIAHAVEVVRQEELENAAANGDDGDLTGALGAADLPKDTWHTPMHLIARPRDVEDRASLKVTLSKLLTSHDVELVSQNVKIAAGVDPKVWPEGLDRTVYALKSVFKNLGGDYLHPDFTLLKGLDWIEAPNSRDLDGKIAGAWAPLERHVGLLFGHFYQWQLAKDAGNEATIIVDTDGLDPVKLAVPVTSFGAIVDHAPTDFDVILLNAYSNSTGAHVVDQFPDYKGNTVQMTTWREPGRTGLSTYIISRDFPDKVFKYAALKGAGYFDTWVVDDLCTHNVLNEEGEIVGPTSSAASQPLLNCYHASGVLMPEVKIKSSSKSSTHKSSGTYEMSMPPSTSSKPSSHSHTKHESSSGKLGDKDYDDEDYEDDDDVVTATSSSSKKKSLDELPSSVTTNAPEDVPLKSAKPKSSSKHSKSEDIKVQDLFAVEVPEAKLGAVPRVHADTSTNEFVSASARERAREQTALLRRRHDAIAERVAERDRVQAMLKDIHALHARGVYAGDEGFSIERENAERSRRARAESEVASALAGLI